MHVVNANKKIPQFLVTYILGGPEHPSYYKVVDGPTWAELGGTQTLIFKHNNVEYIHPIEALAQIRREAYDIQALKGKDIYTLETAKKGWGLPAYVPFEELEEGSAILTPQEVIAIKSVMGEMVDRTSQDFRWRAHGRVLIQLAERLGVKVQ